MRNLKKHLEKIYRKAAFKLVQQGAKLVAIEPAAQQAAAAAADDGSSSSSDAESVSSASDISGDNSSSKVDDSSSTASSSSADSSSQPSSVCEVVYEGDPITINQQDLKEYVGLPPFAQDKFYDSTPVGVVMGLAWTAMGGATLYVEAAPILEVSPARVIMAEAVF